MSVVYALPLPEAISTRRVYFCTVGEQPAVDGQSVAAVTRRSKMPCVLKLELSLLRLPTLHSGSSPAFHEDVQFSGNI